MNNTEEQREVKRHFLFLIDDFYDPVEEIVRKSKYKDIDSYNLGICKLEMEDGILNVYLRQPGRLIGFHGKIIDEISEDLGVKVIAHHVDLTRW